MAVKSKTCSDDMGNVLKALAKISEAITSDSYLEDILKLIVTITAEVTGSKICSLMLINEATGELEIKATQSISENYNKKPNLKLGEGIAGKVAKTGKSIAVLDVRKEESYINRDIAKSEKLCSLLSVPLTYKSKIIGVLNCYTSKVHSFTKSEINIIDMVARQAAIVIENFKLIVESEVVKEELQTRKSVERAKGILMRQKNLSEDDAYKLLRKYSMDRRKSMREIAEAMILNEDLEKSL